MKKASIILSVICLLFCALAGGFLLGRNQNRSEIIISTHPTEATAQPISETESTSTAPTALLVNINTATVEEFQTLPGIGPVLAEKIVEYRKVNGSFSCVADLVNVDGIGETRLSSLLDYLTVGGSQ